MDEAQAIVSWAEAHTGQRKPAPNAGAEHLDDHEIIDVLRWDAQGLSQEEIGAKLNPPRHQSTISRTLRKYGADTRPEARRIFNARAAMNAIKICDEGRPADLIKVQEGINVLQGVEHNALVLMLNGVNLAGVGRDQAIDGEVLSPPQLEGAGEGQ